MSTAHGWDDPAFDPPPYEPDPDVEFELYRDRVDRGEQCPDCRGHGGITRTVACGLPLFTCPRCSASWFDCITRPTMEAAS